ncbi:LysR family transcriptional regulator [Escherichia coli]|nr:LysR family transcriptional regulator [Salmonella enterica]EFB7446744.1 LysR family transcriptional regulator [Escherichia coli]EFB8787922.1 LysR family transcriptional regulator [Escherichia coli]TXX30556.1 LysR family transcriptional regulator [Escherichia coli]
METRYLKSLISVVDCGSIADAARIEYVTAAAIGQRVQALERELGFALLTRTGYTAMPTEACLSLLPRMRRLVSDASLLQYDTDLDGLSGTLRIGAISTVLTGMLPRVLKELTSKAPNARPTIVPGSSLSLFESLQAGKLDAAVVVAPPFPLPKTLRASTLRREPLVLITDKTKRGSAAELMATHPYIRYDPNVWGGRYPASFLADKKLEPTVLCDLDALEAIAMLVADGLGIGLVPEWTGIERFTNECRVRPIPGSRYEREIVLLTRIPEDRPNLLALLAQVLDNHTT